MATKKEWQGYSSILKELFNLEFSPVALNCLSGPIDTPIDKKIRICRTILDAGKGHTLLIEKKNNACFGAGWHLGFNKISDKKILDLVKKFVVEGEKLFCSYQALDKLLSRMEEVPDNSNNYFLLSPMELSKLRPDLVIFICNAEIACRLLTLVIFIDGVMPKIKIGGPTCRMAIMYPLLKRETNLSFYDYTARKICNLEKDKLLISIPYERMPLIMDSLNRCSAGSAKIEYPQEFRELLQKSLAV